MNKKQFTAKYKYFVLMFPKLDEAEGIKQYTYYMMKNGKDNFLKENPKFVPMKVSKMQRKMLRSK